METGQLCVLCGEREATSRDHVPPAGIFPNPRPSDLITVPACTHCNGGSSAQDESFRNYLALHVGTRTPSGIALWRQTGIRGIRRNKRFLREVIAPAERVLLTTPAGVVTGTARRIPWDTSVLESVVRRTVRGLFYHHFNRLLPVGTSIAIHVYKKPGKDLLEGIREWQLAVIGDGQFAYRWCFGETLPECTFWILEFHAAFWVGAYTALELLDEAEDDG